ncbi:MAG: hypothetical protein BPH100C_200 [Phage 5P_2]|nr:MAG: hypothetical protein BPH100C_200 [Phage 5P_2]NPV30479.1 DUF3006 domain-containing protein [Bacillota bacterium]
MLIIDRFEGEWAVIEYGRKTFNFPKTLLPKKAKEGDVITISISIDREATAKRERNIEKLADQLFED